MNLSDLLVHSEKPIVAKNILKEKATVTLLKIKKGEVLKEHQSRTNALLILLNGSVDYEEEHRKVTLSKARDYLYIPEKVTHKVIGEKDSELLLIQ